MPWVRDAIRRYEARGLSVVGVHTPETEGERVRSAVEAAARQEGLSFPHLLDNDYRYWKALGNEYWPALHLVDGCGRLRGLAVGEVHVGAESGRRLEAGIEALLAAPAEPCPAGAPSTP